MTAMRARMRKEIEMLESDPPFGVSAWPKGDQLDRLEAQILGPEGSPYEKGLFHLDIEIPERYPFEPPKVKFLTPIYHPNIDDAGRICLDTLKMQPKGSWMPSVNISTLLTTIRLLMAEPNADDGLMPEITDEFKHKRELFNRKAAELTNRDAKTESALKTANAANSTPKETMPAQEESDESNRKYLTSSKGSEAPGRKAVAVAVSKQLNRRDDSDSFSDEDNGFSEESDFSEDEEAEVDRSARAKRQRSR